MKLNTIFFRKTLFMVTTVIMVMGVNQNTHADNEKISPWLLTPTFSSDPKMGSSIGFLGAYLKRFDETSPASMFGIMATYSDTDSFFYGAFANTHFDQDRQRLAGAVAKGKINNDYEDFLGIGYPVSSTDDLDVLALRYSRRYFKSWYLGCQLVSTNYAIIANDALSGAILDFIGLHGHTSNAVGLVAQHDTRDNLNSTSSGSLFGFNNLFYRKSFGGEASFDAYNMSYATFMKHGNGHVAAFRIKGRWTHGAPPSGYSTIQLKGYTQGEYLAPHMTSIEIDERIKIKGRWGLTLSTGLAGLYGGKDENAPDNALFPCAAVGGTFMIKPQEKMVVRTEYAMGKSGHHGFYLNFGQPF